MNRDEEALKLGARAIPAYPGYYVTNDGIVFSVRRVASHKPMRRLKPNPSGDYDTCGLCHPGLGAITVHGHRIVAWAWLKPPIHGQTVLRHLDGNSRNNCAANLQWGTQQENIEDKWHHGTMAVGARNGHSTKPESTPRGGSHCCAKLTDEDVIAIRSRLAKGEKGVRLAEEFGIRKTTISSIKTGRNWKHLPVQGAFL